MKALLAGVLAIAVGAVAAFAGLRLLAGPDDGGSSITVFAAVSLRDAAEPLAAAWAELDPDQPLRFSFAGSNVLAAQIVEGAAADVFLSADLGHAAEVRAAVSAAGDVTAFAGNLLALVQADGADLSGPLDLGAPGTRVVAAGADVPISRYAAELLELLAATTPAPAAFLDSVAANVVSREDNVRGALTKVELGEADAAIVYASDAATADGAQLIPLPPAVSVMATYGALQVSRDQGAEAFVAWLGSPEARRILGLSGFHPPPS